MSKTSVQIGLAVAVGAFLGALIGLRIDDYFGVWGPAALVISMVSGGCISYIYYDFATVWRAMPVAWKAAREAVRLVIQWRPSNFLKFKMGLIMKLGLLACLVVMMLIATLSIGLTLLICLGSGAGDQTLARATLVTCLFSGGMSSIAMGVVIGTCIEIMGVEYTSEAVCEYDEFKEFMYELIRHGNPIAVYGYWLPRGVWYAVRNLMGPGLWVSVVLTKTFTCTLFREIHSDLRLICLVDGAIFAGIGYASGSMVWAGAAAVAGGLFGIFNWQIVSRRWLKVRLEKV